MLTREEALAIYHAGPETVVRVLLGERLTGGEETLVAACGLNGDRHLLRYPSQARRRSP